MLSSHAPVDWGLGMRLPPTGENPRTPPVSLFHSCMFSKLVLRRILEMTRQTVCIVDLYNKILMCQKWLLSFCTKTVIVVKKICVYECCSQLHHLAAEEEEK